MIWIETFDRTQMRENRTTRVRKERWFGVESLEAEGTRRLQDMRRAISDPNLILTCASVYILPFEMV